MEQLSKAISVTGLSFAYSGPVILKDVDIEIESGKLTFILGQNGSGKSTFLKILAGLLHFQKGSIKISGKETTKLSFSERSRMTGFLNQSHKAVFPFSVGDVVLTGRAGFINYIPKKIDIEAAGQAMEKAGILHLKNRNYAELSGGEQQLVMIARLLAQNPKILLLDEPTTHLDFTNQSHLIKLLKNLVQEGLTIIAVIHDPNLAFLFGDDFLFVKDKKVIRSDESSTAWDIDFLKTIYHGNIQSIPYNGRALLVPS
ncbi:MAG: ABC transporter ATP-binding protein [Bacteroidales bacterium]|nr:ABC transporter ATP-binding protein [Bacteroidales bacterium]